MRRNTGTSNPSSFRRPASIASTSFAFAVRPGAVKATLPLVRKVATSSNPACSKAETSFALGALRVLPRLTARRKAA